MKVEILPVWKKVTPALGEELMAFWRSNKAIVDDATAAARALQAVCIARDEAGAICGVGTATFIGYSPRGTHLYVSYFDSAVLQPPAPIRAPVPAPRATNVRSTHLPSNPFTARRTSVRS